MVFQDKKNHKNLYYSNLILNESTLIKNYLKSLRGIGEVLELLNKRLLS